MRMFGVAGLIPPGGNKSGSKGIGHLRRHKGLGDAVSAGDEQREHVLGHTIEIAAVVGMAGLVR